MGNRLLVSAKAARRECAFRHGFGSRTGWLSLFWIGIPGSRGVFPLRFPSPFDPLRPSNPFPPSHPTHPICAIRFLHVSPLSASIDARTAIRRPFATPNPKH